MDTYLHTWCSVGWNYLSIPKLQRLHRSSLGMDYLSMLWLKLSNVNNRGPRNYLWYVYTHIQYNFTDTTNHTNNDVIGWTCPLNWPVVKWPSDPPWLYEQTVDLRVDSYATKLKWRHCHVIKNLVFMYPTLSVNLISLRGLLSHCPISKSSYTPCNHVWHDYNNTCNPNNLSLHDFIFSYLWNV